MSQPDLAAAQAAFAAYAKAKSIHDDMFEEIPLEAALHFMVEDINAFLEAKDIFARISAGSTTKHETVFIAYRKLYPDGVPPKVATAQAALAIQAHLLPIFDKEVMPTLNYINDIVRDIRRTTVTTR